MNVGYEHRIATDGPLMRIYQFDATGACALVQTFEALAKGEINDFVLTDQDGVEADSASIEPFDLDADIEDDSDCRFVLSAGPTNRGIMRSDDGVTFECQFTHERWAELAVLTEPFCRQPDPERYAWLEATGDIAFLLTTSGFCARRPSTPNLLYEAAKEGVLSEAQSLLQQGVVEVDRTDGRYGQMALMIAAQRG